LTDYIYYILRIYFYFYKEIRYILIYWYMNFDDLDGNNYAFSNHLSDSSDNKAEEEGDEIKKY
jgi:hypothetical protein